MNIKNKKYNFEKKINMDGRNTMIIKYPEIKNQIYDYTIEYTDNDEIKSLTIDRIRKRRTSEYLKIYINYVLKMYRKDVFKHKEIINNSSDYAGGFKYLY